MAFFGIVVFPSCLYLISEYLISIGEHTLSVLRLRMLNSNTWSQLWFQITIPRWSKWAQRILVSIGNLCAISFVGSRWVYFWLWIPKGIFRKGSSKMWDFCKTYSSQAWLPSQDRYLSSRLKGWQIATLQKAWSKVWEIDSWWGGFVVCPQLSVITYGKTSWVP